MKRKSSRADDDDAYIRELENAISRLSGIIDTAKEFANDEQMKRIFEKMQATINEFPYQSKYKK